MTLFLKKLTLLNFKNFQDIEFSFSSNVNCFLGNNGTGKTNVLDAIYYLCFCKSFINPTDSQNIQHEQPFFVIQGEFVKEEKSEQVYCSMKRNTKKQFKRNKKEYERLADHIGLFPLVVISPLDNELITEGSDIRRKFMDGVIAQFDKLYLENLINYNKVLAHRNALLKRFAETHTYNKDELKIWDQQMIRFAEPIFTKRMEFVEQFIPIFQKYFEILSEGKEKVGIEYLSQLTENNLEALLDIHLKRDRTMQHSTAGTHKDDLLFKLMEYPLKKIASQGQQKTFLIALKLAELDYIKSIKNITPILLLDDIFDKLDHTRVSLLMNIVSTPNFGQIFITDTSKEQLPAMMEGIKTFSF